MTIEFLPGLWVGKKNIINNNDFLLNKNIKNFVNVERDLNFLDKSNEYRDCIKKNIERYESIKFSNYLLEITKYIKTKLYNNENVLIYCNNGINKCSYILLAYLIRYGNVNLNIAKNIINTKIINLNTNEIKYIETFNIFSKNIN